MTVTELIELLKGYRPDAIVKIETPFDSEFPARYVYSQGASTVAESDTVIIG